MQISIEFYIYLTVSGVIGGILAGMYGIGGGLVYTFILPSFFALFPQHELGSAHVIANSFVGVLFAALSSAVKVHKDGEMDYKQVFIAGGFAMFSSLLVNQFVVTQSWYSMNYFRIVVMLMIFLMAINLLRKKDYSIKRAEDKKDMPMVGFFGGIVAALSGFGGGVIMVPFMMSLGIFELRKAKNISLGIIVIVSLVIVVRSMLEPSIEELSSIGYILPLVAVPMIIGTIIGGPFGVWVSKKMKEKVLLNSYISLLICLMLYYGYKML